MKIYSDANPRTIAFQIDGGTCGYQNIPEGYSSMEAEYMAIIYALNEFATWWNKELDTRQYDGLSDEELTATSNIIARTKRPKPPPICICCDNEVVVKQLSRQYHIREERLRKLAVQIWNQTRNMDVIYQWVSRKENLAGMLLK